MSHSNNEYDDDYDTDRARNALGRLMSDDDDDGRLEERSLVTGFDDDTDETYEKPQRGNTGKLTDTLSRLKGNTAARVSTNTARQPEIRHTSSRPRVREDDYSDTGSRPRASDTGSRPRPRASDTTSRPRVGDTASRPKLRPSSTGNTSRRPIVDTQEDYEDAGFEEFALRNSSKDFMSSSKTSPSRKRPTRGQNDNETRRPNPGSRLGVDPNVSSSARTILVAAAALILIIVIISLVVRSSSARREIDELRLEIAEHEAAALETELLQGRIDDLEETLQIQITTINNLEDELEELRNAPPPTAPPPELHPPVTEWPHTRQVPPGGNLSAMIQSVYNVTNSEMVAWIARVNNIRDPNNVFVGQVITFPNLSDFTN